MTLVLNGTTGVSSVDGSASTPAIQGTDSNTGVFFPAADTVAIATGGTERMRVDSSGNVGINITSPGTFGKLALQVDGATTPTNATNVGPSSISLYAATNGGSTNSTVGIFGWQASQPGIGSGIGFSRENSSDWGSQIRFYTHPTTTSNISDLTERARIDSSGNLLVNTTSADARFVVVDAATSGWGARILKSSGSGTPQGLQVVVGQNSSNEVFQCAQGTSFGSITNLFKVNGNGLINTATASSSPYNNTTGSAANMVVTSAGDLQRSTSSLKYKTDINDATHGLAEVMLLRPVTYKGKNDGDIVFGGLIAEEVHAAGLTEFVQYAEDGSPDALAYGNMVSLCIKAIQELKAELDTAKARIAALEAA